MTNIVNHFCPTVDFWGVNAYSRSELPKRFSPTGPGSQRCRSSCRRRDRRVLRTVMIGLEDYVLISADGAYDEPNAGRLRARALREIASNLSAAQLDNVCLGGTVFRWNDEWWKASCSTAVAESLTPWAAQIPWVFSPQGGTPGGHADSTANEEWFGVVAIDRQPRLLYSYLQQDFASVEVPTDLDGDRVAGQLGVPPWTRTPVCH